jgi:hypothetical protein
MFRLWRAPPASEAGRTQASQTDQLIPGEV